MADEVFEDEFHKVEVKRGADAHADSGWYWTSSFPEDPTGEKGYHATREDVSVWNVSPLIKWRFEGPDAPKALEHIGTNNVVDLKVGRVRYSLLLDDDGKMIDEGTIYRISDTAFFYMINNEGEAQEAHWDKYLGNMDVKITNVARGMPNLAIQGPRSREVATKLAPKVDVAGLKYFNFITEPVDFAGAKVWLTRTGYSGELGYEVFLTNPDDAGKVYEAVVAENAYPIGTDAVLRYRAESGLVITGVDYSIEKDPKTNPYNIGLDHAIKLDHDFVGKAGLEADAANPPNRYVTLKVEGDEESGYGADVVKDGRVVGIARSPAVSPKFGSITLATVPTELSAPGTEFEVVWEAEGEGEKRVKAVADVNPLYDNKKQRVRM